MLLNGEFRESVGIDFLVSDSESIRDLRLMAKAGFDSFFRTGAARIKPLCERRRRQSKPHLTQDLFRALPLAPGRR